MRALMEVTVPEWWTPVTVVGVAGPVPIGDQLVVCERVPNGPWSQNKNLGVFEVTHLYRFQCDDSDTDDWLAIQSPGTTHTTILHGKDYRPAVQTEWAVGLGPEPVQ